MDGLTRIEPQLVSLQAALVARRETVATAESCTGGLVATLLTHLPGSSAVYLGGVSSYANEAKTALLGVDADLLARYGAVSEEVAQAMARGARERLRSTYAIALTGIAGPDGGRPDKPVGTVYCGLASPRGVYAALFRLTGDRASIRFAAAERALAALAEEINRSSSPV